MDLTNNLGFPAAYTTCYRTDGRELLIVVVKGTFTLPTGDGDVIVAAEQVPPVESDEFMGDPETSAPLYECEFAPFKPRCDVLLHGSAYAPRGRSARRVPVGMSLGSWSKSFDVVGDRVWRRWLMWVSSTDPKPFKVLPISYERAFGGVDRTHSKPDKHRTFLANHVGVGYHASTHRARGPLPNTEERKQRVRNPRRAYAPMSFGPVGRGWRPRIELAGTYDQNWVDHVAPFLPEDFQDDYYQSAPADQQVPYPKGGEIVRLTNLTPLGNATFRLPQHEVPITVFLRDGDPVDLQPVIDTVVIEPDHDRLMLTWRASYPLRRNIFEIEQVVVGRMSAAWYRARELGKIFAPDLRAAVLAPKRRAGNVRPRSAALRVEETR